MDHPDVVTHLAVLDGVPVGEALARADARFATASWHWFFYARPQVPERVITADADAWYGTEASDPGRALRVGEENDADHLAAVRDPAVVRAVLEDYRAGLGVDRDADDADRAAGRQVVGPTLVAWSTEDDLEDLHGDVLAVWRPWAPDLRGVAVPSGHHIVEEAPAALTAGLLPLLRTPRR